MSDSLNSESRLDIAEFLRSFTPARVDLRRAGASPSTTERLRFNADHALARDAVKRPLDVVRLTSELKGIGVETVLVHSMAATLEDHLIRPDLGRRLLPEDRIALFRPVQTSFVVADGLSAGAVVRYAPRLLSALGGASRVVAVKHGRVAIGDEIGEAQEASLSVVLIGERPGLSAAESMGVYVTYSPRVGRTDAERWCISNIRDDGTTPEIAAEQLRSMMNRAESERRTGV